MTISSSPGIEGGWPHVRHRHAPRVAGSYGIGIHVRLIGDIAYPLTGERGGVVLCFHDVEPARFTRWMEALAQRFRLVSMDELLDRHGRGLSLARLVAITFDDGWAGTCHPIAETCTRREWPIMIYAISSVVTRGGSLWFAELPVLLRAALGHRLVHDGRELDFTGRRAASTSTRALVHALRAMPAGRALREIDALWAALGARAPARRSAPFVDEHFVRRYANSPWVRFGAHTVDHQSLASQDEPAQIRQLVESKAVLADLTGRPVDHFCYPYGDPEAIGPVAPRLVRSVYRSATTMLRGVCSARSDPWYLPRISLYDSDSDARMLAKIALAGIV